MSLWWHHNIYLWRHNGARRHARAKHYEYFMLENCTQTTPVYWSKNPIFIVHLYLVKQFKIESNDIFQILQYFQNVDVYYINRYLTVWGFTIVLPQVPLFEKIVRFFHSFVDSCIWTICHNKDFTGRVLLWENFISARNNKDDFPGKVQIPKWALFASNGTAKQITGKSWNHRGQYWTLDPVARKPCISHPSVG